MAVEIEKKYRLDPEQRTQIVEALQESGAELRGEDLEENIIYGGGILDEKGAVLRIRKTASKTILTFKQRVENKFDVKQHIEYESEFADFTSLSEIIKNLGFVPRLVYEKRRQTWHFRETEIVLDVLPFGHFMEIEGSITAIKEAEILLGIEDIEIEHETYPRLTARLGKLNGGIIEARF